MLEDAMSEVWQVFPQLKLRVFVDELRLRVLEKHVGVLQAMPKVANELKRGMQEVK